MNIKLTKDEALVLYDYIYRISENEELFEDIAEQQVLWSIEAQFDKELLEPLMPEYKAIINRARENVRNGECYQGETVWRYTNVTQDEFEKVKEKIENFIVDLGGECVDIKLPYLNKTLSFSNGNVVDSITSQKVFKYEENYCRVDGVCFDDKPYIVIELGTHDDLINNVMEDAEPFPYDLSESELLLEVKCSLGIISYPNE